MMTSKAARNRVKQETSDSILCTNSIPCHGTRPACNLSLVFLTKGIQYDDTNDLCDVPYYAALNVPFDRIERLLFTPISIGYHGGAVKTRIPDMSFRTYFRRYIRDGFCGAGMDDYQNTACECMNAAIIRDFRMPMFGGYESEDEYRRLATIQRPLLGIGLYLVENGFMKYPIMFSEPDYYHEIYLELLLSPEYLDKFRSIRF